MAHLRDGWHFQRLDDGTVHILVKRSESYDAPTLARIKLSPAEWLQVTRSVRRKRKKGGSEC